MQIDEIRLCLQSENPFVCEKELRYYHSIRFDIITQSHRNSTGFKKGHLHKIYYNIHLTISNYKTTLKKVRSKSRKIYSLPELRNK